MAKPHIIVLAPLDAMELPHRIREADLEYQEAVDILAEATEQSSETYHDNAPWDAANDHKKHMAGRVGLLRSVASRAVIHEVPEQPEYADIGARLEIQTQSGLVSVDLVGDWYDRTVRPDEVVVVTAQSEVGSLLAGRQAGDEIAIGQNAYETWKIISIERQVKVDTFFPPPLMHTLVEMVDEGVEVSTDNFPAVFFCGPFGIDRKEIAQQVMPEVPVVDWVELGATPNLEVPKAGFSQNGLIIVGCNNEADIHEATKRLSIDNYIIFYLYAPKPFIHKNRTSETKKMTKEEIDAVIEEQTRKGLLYLSTQADHKVLVSKDPASEAAVRLREIFGPQV